jgi:hypothetical protein
LVLYAVLGGGLVIVKKDEFKKLMLKHYPLSTEDRGCVYWYCNCGTFIDFLSGYRAHVDEVVDEFFL